MDDLARLNEVFRKANQRFKLLAKGPAGPELSDAGRDVDTAQQAYLVALEQMNREAVMASETETADQEHGRLARQVVETSARATVAFMAAETAIARFNLAQARFRQAREEYEIIARRVAEQEEIRGE